MVIDEEPEDDETEDENKKISPLAGCFLILMVGTILAIAALFMISKMMEGSRV